MSGEIVPHKAADVDRADITAEMVTAALEESKAWLAKAMEGTDPTPIANFKAWAATVEEATRQKRLGREIELDAAEMVRRAERGIGVAIRKGQEAGAIRTRADGGWPDPSSKSASDHEDSKVSPRAFLKNGQERADTYAVTDGITDEQFDAAIAEAKIDGNLSRANVVRKVKESGAAPRSQQHTADRISELADEGYSTRQIAKQIGMSEAYIRRTCKQFDINVPADKAIGRTRRHDSNRIAQQTVDALAGLAMGVDLIDYDDLDVGETGHWATSLDDSLRALNRFRKQIREMT